MMEEKKDQAQSAPKVNIDPISAAPLRQEKAWVNVLKVLNARDLRAK